MKHLLAHKICFHNLYLDEAQIVSLREAYRENEQHPDDTHSYGDTVIVVTADPEWRGDDDVTITILAEKND